MDKKFLTGISIIAGVLLFLGSLTNVVGYQTVQSSDSYPVVEHVQKESTQTIESECDCEKINKVYGWHFPVICTILFIPYSIGIFLYDLAGNMHLFFLLEIIEKMVSPLYQIAKVFNCSWLITPDFE